MDEKYDPSVSADDQEADIPEQPRRGFLRGRFRMAAAAGVAGAIIAGGAVTAVEQNNSQAAEIKADVPYQAYGKDGQPAPHAVMQKSHDPAIEKIIPVPSNNPFELAQQALYIAAKEKSANRIAYGMDIVLRPGTTFYHSMPGSSTFMPANPVNNGEAGKFEVSNDEVAVIENPRFIVTSVNDDPENPVYIAATLAGNTNTMNRATDINQVYFISVPQVYKDLYNGREGFLSAHGPGVPLGEPGVDNAGNLHFGNVPSSQLSVIRNVKLPTLEKMKSEQGLRPTTPTAGR